MGIKAASTKYLVFPIRDGSFISAYGDLDGEVERDICYCPGDIFSMRFMVIPAGMMSGLILNDEDENQQAKTRTDDQLTSLIQQEWAQIPLEN